MRCKCGHRVFLGKVSGVYHCLNCAQLRASCDCPTPRETPVPDTPGPIPEGLSLWSDR